MIATHKRDINSILCVVDFSEGTREALMWAVFFSTEYGARLTILYSYRLTRGLEEDVFEWKKRREQDIGDKFLAYETELLLGTSLNYEFKMEVGFVVDRIEEFTRRNRVSFIIIDKPICVSNRQAFDDLLEQMTVPVMIAP
ncbi:MAG: universal stress protein [Chryseolinea sp.]